VDKGQYEAAYAPGHSSRRTFFSIILPQAVPHILPAYRGEIVAIIKATAVVGYIAVQDPTKMGDIVSETEFRIPAAFPGTRIVPGMKNSRILTCGFSSECSKWQRQGRDIRRGATVWRR